MGKVSVDADELSPGLAETIRFLPGAPNPVLTGVPPSESAGEAVLELPATERVDTDRGKGGGGCPDPSEFGRVSDR